MDKTTETPLTVEAFLRILNEFGIRGCVTGARGNTETVIRFDVLTERLERLITEQSEASAQNEAHVDAS